MTPPNRSGHRGSTHVMRIFFSFLEDEPSIYNITSSYLSSRPHFYSLCLSHREDRSIYHVTTTSTTTTSNIPVTPPTHLQ